MRGLFSATVLDELEQAKSGSIQDYFSVFAGTSIGGILAIGLAANISPAHMKAAIRKHGKSIFRRRKWGSLTNPFDLFASPYAQKPLREAIEEILQDKASLTLDQIETPVVVTAVEHNRAIAKVFVSRHLAAPGDDLSPMLIDVALATSAAPTYFPPHKIGDRVYLDGGLIANAPDLVTVQKCIEVLATDLDDLHVLSVGTAARDLKGDIGIGAPGRISWLLHHALFDITVESQSDLAVSQVRAILRDRIYRIDSSPSTKITLDETRADKLDELERLAREAVTEFRANGRAWSRFFVDR